MGVVEDHPLDAYASASLRELAVNLSTPLNLSYESSPPSFGIRDPAQKRCDETHLHHIPPQCNARLTRRFPRAHGRSHDRLQ